MTCRGVIRGPFHCLCWKLADKTGLCKMHRKDGTATVPPKYPKRAE